MVALTHAHTRQIQPVVVTLRIAVVTLTLATAAIHVQLGGLMFLANALGYAVLAGAMVAPGRLGRSRWLARLALIGFTAATIVGWFLFGARFDLAYLDKAIEVALIAVLGLELWLIDGGPLAVIRRGRRTIAITAAKVSRLTS